MTDTKKNIIHYLLILLLVPIDVRLFLPHCGLGPVVVESIIWVDSTVYKQTIFNRAYAPPILLFTLVLWLAKKTRKAGFAAVVLALSLLLQYAYPADISSECGTLQPTSTGFSKIKPDLASAIAHVDGTVEVVFTNELEKKVYVADKGVTVSGYPFDCGGPITVDPTTVPPKESFKLVVKGCPTGNTGEPYTFRMKIPYTTDDTGMTKPEGEEGIINGPYG